jgi:acetyl esterase
MPLDPRARTLIDTLMGSGAPELDELPVEEARLAITGLFAAQAEPEAVGGIEDRTIPGPGGMIPIRIYRPTGHGPWPLLVFLHGGGWVIGDLDSHDAFCRRLTNAVPAVVVGVHYRRAPEHRFPAAAEDAYAALRWAAVEAPALGADPRRVAVAGDSAGGNLSAAVSLMARDRGGPAIAQQVLVYPVTDAAMDTPSYVENADGYFLTAKAMRWFWGHYLGESSDGAHPYASPLRAPDLRRLPPALIQTAEYDPLRDEGEAYARRLQDAGVPVTLTRYDGMIHGFASLTATFPQAGTALAEIVTVLRAAFV